MYGQHITVYPHTSEHDVLRGGFPPIDVFRYEYSKDGATEEDLRRNRATTALRLEVMRQAENSGETCTLAEQRSEALRQAEELGCQAAIKTLEPSRATACADAHAYMQRHWPYPRGLSRRALALPLADETCSWPCQ